MLGRNRRLSAALSEEARQIYGRIRSYPAIDGIGNPVTRRIIRQNVAKIWGETRQELDFPYDSEEIVFNDVPGLRLTTATHRGNGPVILYIHAGAFVAGSPETNAAGVLPLCQLTGAEAYAVRYSLAPETCFPVALHEITEFYAGLIAANKGRPVFLMGDSAGANLALSCLMDWRDGKRPLPEGAILVSGCLDGTTSSDTIITMQRFDPLMKNRGDINLGSIFRHYAGEADVDDPRISPLLREVSGLPPLLVQVGSREMLLGDSARLCEKARQAGVPATLRVFDGMFHLFHLHWSLPEARAAHEDMADFLRRHGG